MEEFYTKRITYLLEDLRKTLVTAICYYLEQGRPLQGAITVGDTLIDDVRTVFDDRGHTSMSDTVLNVRVIDEDGPSYEREIPLDKADNTLLLPLWKRLRQSN